MALYCGMAAEQPLPAPWNTLAINSIEVKTAFTNYARRIVDTMQPDVLAIGIEHNVLLTSTPALWPALKELHRHVYDATSNRCLHTCRPMRRNLARCGCTRACSTATAP
jgi:hypothetical protein